MRNVLPRRLGDEIPNTLASVLVYWEERFLSRVGSLKHLPYATGGIPLHRRNADALSLDVDWVELAGTRHPVGILSSVLPKVCPLEGGDVVALFVACFLCL